MMSDRSLRDSQQMSYRGLIVCVVAIVVAFAVGWWPFLGGRNSVVVMILAMVISVAAAVRYHLAYRDYLRRWRQGE